MPYKMTQEERDREKAMMQQRLTSGWPMWPYLPIKRSNPNETFPDFGVLFDDGPLGQGVHVEPIVYDCKFWALAAGQEPFDKTKIKAQYDSFDALLDDGWVVD